MFALYSPKIFYAFNKAIVSCGSTMAKSEKGAEKKKKKYYYYKKKEKKAKEVKKKC